VPLPPLLRDRLTLPAVVAPMFLCSGVELASEACNAGIVGSLTRNHCRDIEELAAQLAAVSARTAAFEAENPTRRVGPLAVNISQRLSRDEMRKHVDLCRRYGVSIIITASGDPGWAAPVIRDSGILHYHDATSIRFAEKAIEAGVDGIIAICAGGGGHSGDISHLTLIPQIRAMFAGTVIMAGAVANGAAIRAAEILGADLAYIGTRFIATRESLASDAYKAMLVEVGADDVIYTPAINGVPANWLKPSLRDNGLDPENLPLPGGGEPTTAQRWKSLWSAGHGVSLISDVPPAAELVRRLQREYVAACRVSDMAGAAVAALGQDARRG
jgi:nitronate monooxygenase